MRQRRSAVESPWPVAAQLNEIAWAVPQVVAYRTARLMLAGARPSARDRREFERMGIEKWAAFTESWIAMALQAWRAPQQMALDAAQSAWLPWVAATHAQSRSQGGPLREAVVAILRSGIEPVRRRAVANARRLGRPRRA